MKNEITISTEEYKDLVSRTMPDNNDKWFVNKLEEFLLENCKINDNKLDTKNDWDFADNFMKFFKLVNLQMYKKVFNILYDEKIKKETDKLKMEKARANKDMEEE